MFIRRNAQVVNERSAVIGTEEEVKWSALMENYAIFEKKCIYLQLMQQLNAVRLLEVIQ